MKTISIWSKAVNCVDWDRKSSSSVLDLIRFHFKRRVRILFEEHDTSLDFKVF